MMTIEVGGMKTFCQFEFKVVLGKMRFSAILRSKPLRMSFSTILEKKWK